MRSIRDKIAPHFLQMQSFCDVLENQNPTGILAKPCV